MTIKINLLPWREIHRKKEKQRLISLAFAGLTVVVAACLLTNYCTFNLIDKQQNDNHKLREKIAILTTKIQEIHKIKETKKRLINRIILLQKLQNNRVLIVHLFDELIKLMPDGLYLNQIRCKGTEITLEGVTKSHIVLTKLMQNIEANPWMQASKLIEIKKDKPLAASNRFRLIFVLQPQNRDLT